MYNASGLRSWRCASERDDACAFRGCTRSSRAGAGCGCAPGWRRMRGMLGDILGTNLEGGGRGGRRHGRERVARARVRLYASPARLGPLGRPGMWGDMSVVGSYHRDYLESHSESREVEILRTRPCRSARLLREYQHLSRKNKSCISAYKM